MRLFGIHHVAALCSDLGRSAEFYSGLLGLTAHPTDPEEGLSPALAFADQGARPGSIIVLAEQARRPRGRAGAGQVHTVRWRVGSVDALDHWRERLVAAGIPLAVRGGADPALGFRDPDGLAHAIVLDRSSDQPLVARAPGIPSGFELRGFDGVRAFARDPVPTGDLLAGRLEFATAEPTELLVAGAARTSAFGLDEPPRRFARRGPGIVDHVAWGCERADQPAWRQRVIGMGARVTPIRPSRGLDSLYFREPAGILFELCAGSETPAARERPAVRRSPGPALQPV